MQCYKLTWMSTARVKSGSEVPCKPVDRLLFNASTIVTVGDGMKTQFWHHSWLDGEVPRNLATYLFELVRRKNRSVQHELHNHTWIRALRGRITTVTHVEEFVSLWIRIFSCSPEYKTPLPRNGRLMENTRLARHIAYSSMGASGNSAQTLFGKHIMKINASSLHGS